jgi:GNAT superfamily N-acetyltransferase
MTHIRIVEEHAGRLHEYGTVPISFTVTRILEVREIDHGLGGVILEERHVAAPYVKDYDAIEGEGPARWATTWDISNWGIIAAFNGDARVGGCVVAYDTPGIHKLEGRKDITALWDIRVAPELRGRGIGSQVLAAAAAWSVERGSSMLKAETQNINLPACRFYAGHGFALGVISRFSYVEFPDEVELVWYKRL